MRRLPVNNRQLDEYLAFACRLAELAGGAILPYFRSRMVVENKGRGGAYDPVTVADEAAEEAIRREIRRVYPEHAIYGEERGRSPGSGGFTWVIDPIDGTRSFILGQLHWGTLIALNDGARPVVGVAHQPYVGETFIGSERGAELRRGGSAQPLKTRPCARLKDAALCATHPDLFKVPAERRAFDLVASRVRLTRFGGDCYSYCLLAAGLVDLVIEAGLQAYDVQALIPIVERAGGIMTTWAGGAAYDGGRVIAAGDRRMHRAALRILARAPA